MKDSDELSHEEFRYLLLEEHPRNFQEYRVGQNQLETALPPPKTKNLGGCASPRFVGSDNDAGVENCPRQIQTPLVAHELRSAFFFVGKRGLSGPNLQQRRKRPTPQRRSWPPRLEQLVAWLP